MSYKVVEHDELTSMVNAALPLLEVLGDYYRHSNLTSNSASLKAFPYHIRVTCQLQVHQGNASCCDTGGNSPHRLADSWSWESEAKSNTKASLHSESQPLLPHLCSRILSQFQANTSKCKMCCFIECRQCVTAYRQAHCFKELVRLR